MSHKFQLQNISISIYIYYTFTNWVTDFGRAIYSRQKIKYTDLNRRRQSQISNSSLCISILRLLFIGPGKKMWSQLCNLNSMIDDRMEDFGMSWNVWHESMESKIAYWAGDHFIVKGEKTMSSVAHFINKS